MKILRNVSRYVIAVVFIFSGFVKAIDPMGSTYKFSDYFEAFGLDFLTGLSLIFALILSSAELLIGLCLFFKIRMRAAAWALMIFMAYFSILTLFIAITNPVTDCGCFGDALILTNWQTFFKNIFFLIPTLIVFQQRNKFINHFKPLNEWILTAALFAAAMILSIYSIRNLPLIDFRPYSVGTNIPSGMEIPEGMPVDQYKTILVYEKNGHQQEFALDAPEQPWSDSSWTWVETRNKLVSEGYHPPIHDFSLTSPDGDDYTNVLLSDTGYSLLVVAHDLHKTNLKGLTSIGRFTQSALDKGFRVYGMTATGDGMLEEIKTACKLPFEFFTTDDITLKTMIRSNPALILLKDGTVLAKWHHRNIPDESFFNTQALSSAVTALRMNRNDMQALVVVLLIGLLASLLYIFRDGE